MWEGKGRQGGRRRGGEGQPAQPLQSWLVFTLAYVGSWLCTETRACPVLSVTAGQSPPLATPVPEEGSDRRRQRARVILMAEFIFIPFHGCFVSGCVSRVLTARKHDIPTRVLFEVVGGNGRLAK